MSNATAKKRESSTTYRVKRRWILGLSVLLIGLTALIVVTERQRILDNSPVQLLAVEQANRISINLFNSNQGEQMVLERLQGQWQLTTPINSQVNQDRINPLLSLLTLPDSTAYPAEDVDLSELGLTQPQATIEINEYMFTFGGPGPGDQQRYLLINDHVYLTRDILLPLVAGGVDSLVTQTAN